MKKKIDPRTPERRVRPLLLVLLWIWAGCIALVLDLFLNVEEFDGIRPRAPLYRAMREVAHEMVGETILDGESVAVASRPARDSARAQEDRAVRAVPSSRHPGGKPDAGTPQGRKLFGDLLAAARSGGDTIQRVAAVRSLAGMFGQQASWVLAAIADDTAQPAEVREVATRLHQVSAEGSK